MEVEERANTDLVDRDQFKDHPWYDDCVYFCHNYEQNSFDPDYQTKPLDFFEPYIRRLFNGKYTHLELNLTAQ